MALPLAAQRATCIYLDLKACVFCVRIVDGAKAHLSLLWVRCSLAVFSVFNTTWLLCVSVWHLRGVFLYVLVGLCAICLHID